MILIKEKSGNIFSAYNHNRYVDLLNMEWYETRKRIQHKKTKEGKDILIKFLKENPDFKDGDVVYEDENCIIVVEINPCECIVIIPQDIIQASSVCYEIGNRHLPLFYEGNELLIPFDVPLYNLLEKLGCPVKIAERKLNHSFQTTVLPHLQAGVTVSLPKTNQQLTTSS